MSAPPKAAQSIGNQAVASRRLLRLSRLLDKLNMSKSSLYVKLSDASRYYDPTFPRPFRLPGSRTPLWFEDEIDEWIEHSASARVPSAINIQCAAVVKQPLPRETALKSVTLPQSGAAGQTEQHAAPSPSRKLEVERAEVLSTMMSKPRRSLPFMKIPLCAEPIRQTGSKLGAGAECGANDPNPPA